MATACLEALPTDPAPAAGTQRRKLDASTPSAAVSGGGEAALGGSSMLDPPPRDSLWLSDLAHVGALPTAHLAEDGLAPLSAYLLAGAAAAAAGAEGLAATGPPAVVPGLLGQDASCLAGGWVLLGAPPSVAFLKEVRGGGGGAA